MQKRNRKLVSFCSLATLVISSSVVSTTGVKAADNTTQRIGGADRYETASLISQEGWKDGSDYVVIANGQNYADSLTAAPLAKAKDAPILLTQSNNLDSTVLEEIKKLGAKHFIIVGGDGVVSQGVENKIKSEIASSDVKRYGGADRFETSVKVAEAIGASDSIFVANGLKFPDALSVAPIAAIEGAPIVLTQDNELPDSVSDYIKSESGITKSYVAGGDGVVSDSILNSLPGGERLGGTDRYETNSKVIREFADELDFSNIFVASDSKFPDSLTGSALAAKKKSAVVITAQSVSSYTKDLFKDLLNKNTKIIALGGSAVLPDSVISQLKDAITKSPSTGGGGGGSSSGGDNYSNITDDLKSGTGILSSKYTEYKNKVNNTTLRNRYFTIDDLPGQSDDEYVNVNLKDTTEGINDLQDVFAKAQTRYGIEDGVITDVAKFNQDIEKVNDKLSTHFGNIKINNDKTILQFLSGLGSQYFDEDGKLEPDKIKAVIESHADDAEGAYNDFKNDIDTQIDKYFTQNPEGIKLASQTPKISYESIDVTRVVKGDTVIFNASKNTEDAVKQLENNFVLPAYNSDRSYFTGTYKLYLSGSDYIDIKVNPSTAEN
ncbi:MAG: cell wall-binding repeat-containing protein [Clostridium sp.]|jgi:putative cell wall-binding protein|uniref:cell wall-binding repeat-containing protein n=1 Tax=Clostridium sp. TaxID=1506 RepID=UPI0025C28321|nr:cell wall-binding repeat-containing protein [Clostridium sp.]MCH3965054.1 cell wall-binding repeat-containing protein [Clostridium sp.]MCI1714275.1 cell wall-binding repeat-containing protein [Clostridium sp.]MCI1798537.1 cell wall-binding repeat-containing protein [Clostridium sp.]MCI1812732.1 cell wall-binding repeat-containing protein [Clostridium sp.]MCI1869346.1 cell wall-binding repeat-containing protein [Clostridium sp.]